MHTAVKIFIALIVLAIAIPSCKNENNADPQLQAWGHDTLRSQDNSRRSTGSQRVNSTSGETGANDRLIPNRNNASSGSNGGDEAAGETLKRPDASEASGLSGVPVPGKSGRWWNNRTIFFIDWAGGASDVVYEAVQGQRYFPETRIFIYATSKSMEGTYNYEKIDATMKGTEIDDRIFIWVHVDDKGKPIFVKKIISKNIEGKVDQGPMVI